MQFTSPDTLIPDLYNSLDWNRYSYVRYNPLKYTDPSGHWPESPLSWLSPFAYDTVGFGFSGVLKVILGVDVKVMVYVNAKSVRDAVVEQDVQHLQDFDISVNVEANVSAGASVQAIAGGTILGVDGSVEDQAGVSLSLVDGTIPVNVGGCLPAGLCGTASYGLKTDFSDTTSAAYTVAVGEGVDLGVDIFSISAPVYYQKQNEKGKWFNLAEFSEKSYEKFRTQWNDFWTTPK